MASTQDLGKVRLVAKGAYNSATNYEADDWVTYEGSSYYCKQNSTGHAPTDTTYWGLLASKGDAGASPDITMSATSDGTSSDNPTVNVTKGGTTSNPTYALAFSGLKGGKGDTGDTGDSLTASSVHANDKTTVTIKNARTEATINTFDVPDGEDGKGINNITKTGTSGLVDTYTITYTDGTTSTFTVTNGQDGQGSGDMTKAVYDSAETVANAGGLVAYLAAQLANYYTKSQTYTQTEVNNLISAITTLDIEVVASLPTQDISTTTIYLVPSADPQTQNVKDEYINTDGTSAGWELIGSTAIDLSGYVQKSQTAGLLKNDGTIDTEAKASQATVNGILNGTDIDSFGDVESALADKVDWESNTRTGVHNLFRIDAKTQTINGVTFTVNSKNIITVNNTATSQANFFFTDGFDLHLFAGEYIVSGIPDGAVKNSTFWMYIRNANTTRQFDIMGTAKITINEEDDFKVLIAIANGYTANNLVFKPMLRPAKDSDPTFAPFAKTNRELTEDVAKLSGYLEQSVTLSTSGTTAVTFTDASITTNSQIQYGCSTWGIIPDDITCSSGSCVVTMPKVASAATVTVRIYVR